MVAMVVGLTVLPCDHPGQLAQLRARCSCRLAAAGWARCSSSSARAVVCVAVGIAGALTCCERSRSRALRSSVCVAACSLARSSARVALRYPASAAALTVAPRSVRPRSTAQHNAAQQHERATRRRSTTAGQRAMPDRQQCARRSCLPHCARVLTLRPSLFAPCRSPSSSPPSTFESMGALCSKDGAAKVSDRREAHSSAAPASALCRSPAALGLTRCCVRALRGRCCC